MHQCSFAFLLQINLRQRSLFLVYLKCDAPHTCVTLIKTKLSPEFKCLVKRRLLLQYIRLEWHLVRVMFHHKEKHTLAIQWWLHWCFWCIHKLFMLFLTAWTHPISHFLWDSSKEDNEKCILQDVYVLLCGIFILFICCVETITE